MVYDMSKGKFPPEAVKADDEAAGSVRRPPPLRLADVRYYLELNQLARGTPLFLHSDPVSRGRSQDVDAKVCPRQSCQLGGNGCGSRIKLQLSNLRQSTIEVTGIGFLADSFSNTLSRLSFCHLPIAWNESLDSVFK